MTISRKALLGLAGVSAVIIGAGTYATRPDFDVEEAPISVQPVTPTAMEITSADIVEIVQQDLEYSLSLTGTLQPLRQALIRAKVPGELNIITKREGESVAKGETLARLDDLEARIRLNEREALLESAQAQLELTRRLKSRQQQLHEKNYISMNALEAAANDESVNAANVKVAEAQRDLAQKHLNDTLINAPFSGVIAERLVQAGERLQMDTPLFSLVDLSQLEFEADIPASQIGRVKEGDHVRFWVDGLEGDFTGKVARINPVADTQSRKVKVYTIIDNPAGQLRGGMFAQGNLSTQDTVPTVLVPLSALRQDELGDAVLVLESDSVRRASVRLGRQFPERGMAELLDGPEPGTRILNANMLRLRAGDRITILGADSKT